MGQRVFRDQRRHEPAGDDRSQVRQSCVQAVRMRDTAGAHVSGRGALFNSRARSELHIVRTADTFLHRARLSIRIAPHVGRSPYNRAQRRWLPWRGLPYSKAAEPSPWSGACRDATMITQYDAVAEIEALKLRTTSARSGRRGTTAATSDRQWSRSSEREIREEMERRLAERTNRS